MFSLKWTRTRTPLCSSDSFDKENEDELPLNLSRLSEVSTEYRKAVIGYMGGYVVKQMLKDLSCSICAEALIDDGKLDSQYSHLIRIKNGGGLITPSKEVCRIIEVCEKFFRALTIASNGEQQIGPDGFLFRKLRVSILSELIHQPDNLFSSLIFSSLFSRSRPHERRYIVFYLFFAVTFCYYQTFSSENSLG